MPGAPGWDDDQAGAWVGDADDIEALEPAQPDLDSGAPVADLQDRVQALIAGDWLDAIGPDTRLVRDLAGLRRLRAVFDGEIRLLVNEACFCVQEGVAPAENVDAIMRLGMNHPMGPLQLADFVGLDTCLAIMNVLHDGLADTKYRPCPLLTKYVEAGWLGRKTQRGFYDYRGEVPVPTR